MPNSCYDDDETIHPLDVGGGIRWPGNELYIYDLYNSKAREKSRGPLGCCFLLPRIIFSHRAETELTECSGTLLINSLLWSYRRLPGLQAPTFSFCRIPTHVSAFLVGIYIDNEYPISEIREITKKIVDHLWRIQRGTSPETSLEEEFFSRPGRETDAN